MCTIMFTPSHNVNVRSMLLEHITDRSRDGFGCAIDYDKYTYETYANLVLDVMKNPKSTLFLHGRAVPESEPDYLSPNISELQPIKIKDQSELPPSYLAFHGLVTHIQGKKIDQNTVDTHAVKDYISNVWFRYDTVTDILKIFDDITGSFLITLYTRSYDKHWFTVITNFLSCFYNPIENYVSSVPIISEHEIKLSPYSVTEFEVKNKKLILEATYIKQRESNKFAIIGSGGLDSSTVLAAVQTYYDAKDITLIHFMYGQDATTDELKAVEALAEYHNVSRLKIIDAIELYKSGDPNSLLLSSNTKDIDGIEDMERDVHYVSMRNSLLSIVSAIQCEKYDIDYLALGVNLTEGLVYTDNGNRWFYNMRDLLKVSGKHPIALHAPLLNLLKHEIIKLGQVSGADYSKTISCYHPVDGFACGKCGSCLNRMRAFQKNEMQDPISYVDMPKELQSLTVYTPRKNQNNLKKLVQTWHIDI